MKEKLEIEALTENLDRVLSFVDEYLEKMECPMKLMTKIDLAVEEIFVNIAHYAYGSETGWAVITMDRDEAANKLEIVFEDGGVPFDPLAKEDPDISLSAEERPIGGLGIFMVKKIADDVSYEYRDGKNILSFIKSW